MPLRNLYWNSASRPLRSIASLHINLVQAGTNLTAPSAAEPYHSSTRNGDLGTETSNGASRGGNQRESGTGAKKERRHQIPGLRQTPYLKIFFLRCSDVESYRATHRAQIREWIKENTPPSQSTASLNAQEFHDAFEWLIVHIVLPDDGRAISHPSNTSKSDVRNGFRGSDAVIDKVRADFNGTSKSAIDRVAQVRIQRNAEDVSIPRQDQDPSAGWSDFILKAKSLILSSFDLRVTQYEEDIKERDAQRNIPGWNFNTFFVLKEGLARGFESVGLIEDALTGYRELAAGLDSILEDDENRREQHDHFRDHTDDIALELKRALQADQVQPLDQVNGSTADLLSQDGHDLGSDILDTDRKPFRDLILANDISVFDFRCYLFAREVALLLRLANVSGPTGSESRTPAMFMDKDSTDPSLQATSPDTQHLLLLAEVCRRALDFFASGSRLLRDDLRSSIDPLSKVHATPDISNFSSFEGSIEDLVASWTYSACQCIIDVTNIPSLADRCQTVLRTIKPSDETSGGGRGSAIAAISQEELPRRTSSLPVHAKPSPRFSVPDRPSAINSSDAMRPLPPTSPQTGTQDLAAQRAELVTLKRRVLATVGRRSSCIRVVDAILPSSLDSSITDMEDVPLDDATSIRDDLDNGEGGLNGPGVNSLRNRDLRRGLSTGDAYSKAYEVKCPHSIAMQQANTRQGTNHNGTGPQYYW